MGYYGLTLSMLITADILSKRAVYEDPDTGAAINPTVAGSKCIGICTEDTDADASYAPVQVEKVAPAIFGGAAKIGDSLATDNQGRMVKAAGSAGDTVWCLGFSRSVIAQAGDEGDVLIHPHQVTI